jgi:hypothetical protein
LDVASLGQSSKKDKNDPEINKLLHEQEKRKTFLFPQCKKPKKIFCEKIRNPQKNSDIISELINRRKIIPNVKLYITVKKVLISSITLLLATVQMSVKTTITYPIKKANYAHNTYSKIGLKKY